MTAFDTIHKTISILQSNGWCQGAHARDSMHRACSPSDKKAKTFSIYGALMRSTKLGDVELQETTAYAVLADAAAKIAENEFGKCSATLGDVLSPLDFINDINGQTLSGVTKFMRNSSESVRYTA